jgi:hypothetical protein
MSIFMILFMSFTVMSAETAESIMNKNEEVRKFDRLQADGKIIVGGGSRKELTKTFTWWREIQSDKVHFNTKTLFLTPKEVENQCILFLEASGTSNEILMYLPTYKKTRIIENDQQNGSFMASDFSYADITSLHVEDYTFKLVKEEKCPLAAAGADKTTCFLIESTPKEASTIARTGYSKTLTWIRKDNYMSNQIHYFDSSNNKTKELSIYDLTETSKGHFFSTNMRMTVLKNKQYTTIEFTNINSPSKSFDKKLFSKKFLGK